MEKTIKFEDVMVFIKKAMENNLTIDCNPCGFYIYINDKEEKHLDFVLINKPLSDHLIKKLYIKTSNYGRIEGIILSEEEYLQWKLLVIEGYKYREKKALDCLRDFILL